MEERETVVACQVYVTGRVQGVAFRWRTQGKAEELGVTGWVRNLRDGRVEARLEGPAPILERMLIWIRTGDPPARVDSVEVRDREPEGAQSFQIRSTATS